MSDATILKNHFHVVKIRGGYQLLGGTFLPVAALLQRVVTGTGAIDDQRAPVVQRSGRRTTEAELLFAKRAHRADERPRVERQQVALRRTVELYRRVAFPRLEEPVGQLCLRQQLAVSKGAVVSSSQFPV